MHFLSTLYLFIFCGMLKIKKMYKFVSTSHLSPGKCDGRCFLRGDHFSSLLSERGQGKRHKITKMITNWRRWLNPLRYLLEITGFSNKKGSTPHHEM